MQELHRYINSKLDVALLSEFLFSHLVYCCLPSQLVDLFIPLLDLITSDLHLAIIWIGYHCALVPFPYMGDGITKHYRRVGIFHITSVGKV
jgi:hypothetical protein